MLNQSTLKRWLDNLHRIDPRNLVLQLRICGSIVAALALLILALSPHPATFIADVHTEALTVRIRPDENSNKLDGDPQPEWGQPSIIIHDHEVVPQSCNGSIFEFEAQRKESLDVRIEVARNSAVYSAASIGPGIAVSIRDADKPFAELDCADGTRRMLGAPLTLIYGSQEPRDGLTLHLQGVVSLGSSVVNTPLSEKANRQPLLLDGALVAEATAFPFGPGRSQSETQLHTGDLVTFGSVDPHLGDPAEVLIRTLDGPLTGPLLHVVAHARSEKAFVSISGLQSTGTALAFAPTLWDRMQAMDFWAVALIVGALIFNAVEAALQSWERSKESKLRSDG